MAENVAMKHELTNVTPAEIHAERDAGEWMVRVPVPEWNLDRIQVLTSLTHDQLRMPALLTALPEPERSGQRQL
jgi:hypothetical protein